MSDPNQKIWTMLSILRRSEAHLAEKGIESPRLNAELLLCKVLECERIDLYLKFDMVLKVDEISEYKKVLKRRLASEPLQYIMGWTGFMGLRIEVDRRVFIPRVDTEVLAETAIRLCKGKENTVKRILDIGTGSGNLALSLALKVDGSQVDAIDSSPEALEVARINVEKHGLTGRVNLLFADILKDCGNLPTGAYDCIVSNPPYISLSQYRALPSEIRDFEPEAAATDNADGLTFYRAIASQGNKLLKSGGFLALEMAYNQAQAVKGIFREAGYSHIETVHDQEGIKRVMTAVRD